MRQGRKATGLKQTAGLPESVAILFFRSLADKAEVDRSGLTPGGVNKVYINLNIKFSSSELIFNKINLWLCGDASAVPVMGKLKGMESVGMWFAFHHF